MKQIKFIVVIIFLTICSKSFSQSANAEFLKIKNFYTTKAKKATTSKSSMYFNKAEKMIDFGDTSVPIKDVKILYINVEGVHVVYFNCDECIIRLDKTNNLKYLDGLGIPFSNKDDCYEFINLLSSLREKI